jgi:hypothetical protein
MCKVSGISKLGFWLLLDQKEFFVPFELYPVFLNATINQINDFVIMAPSHIYWKSLDCDIEITALQNPEQFPLSFS